MELTPSRNATSDANAGIVNPPTLKRTTRDVATKQKQVSSLDIGVQKVGSALGSALKQRLSETADNINEQRAVDAALRQGTETAINKIDKDKERIDWEKFWYGQNVEYRVAQQTAAQNKVKDMLLIQSTEVAKYAGESPEEYGQRLKTWLDEELKPYGNDTETKRLIAAQWAVASAKLAGMQYEDHYAYTQTQLRKEEISSITRFFDQLNVEANRVTTPEEAKRITDQTAAFFAGKAKPVGVDDIAYRSMTNEVLENSLRADNVGPYNAAVAAGWIKGLNLNERVSMDQAHGAYVEDFTKKVALTYEEAELLALEAKTLNQASAIYQNLRTSIAELTTRSTGSDKEELALARNHTKSQTKINNIKKAQDDILKKAGEAAIKAQQKLERDNRGKAALRNPTAEGAGGVLADYKGTELTDLLDAMIVEDVNDLVPEEDITTMRDASAVLLKAPDVALKISKWTSKLDVKSKLVETSLRTFLNGYTSLVTEEHTLNEQGRTAMTAINQFARDNKSWFTNTVGGDLAEKFFMVQRNLDANKTIPQIEKQWENYQEYKGKKDILGIDWGMPEGKDKRDVVGNMYNTAFKTYDDVSFRTVSEGLVYMDNAIVRNAGDVKAAKSDYINHLQASTINYRGHSILNGQKLNSYTDYNFKQLMDGAYATTGTSASLMTPFLTSLGYDLEDKDGNPVVSSDQINNIFYFTVDGEEGFYIDAQDARAPVPIRPHVMRRWAEEIEQRTRIEQDREERRLNDLDAWMSEQYFNN